MADATVSQPAPIVKENNDIRFHSLGSAPAVLSTEVARHFQRKHQHILRDIDKIISMCPQSFNASNFGRVDLPDAKGEKRRAFLLTRDALSLLVMGMTGKAAILWKLRYIEAFNLMEARIAGMARLEARLHTRELPQTRAIVEEASRRVWQLGTVQKRRLRSAVRYRKLGLGIHAIGRLLRINSREVSTLIKAAQDLGWLDTGPRQGMLTEACHA